MRGRLRRLLRRVLLRRLRRLSGSSSKAPSTVASTSMPPSTLRFDTISASGPSTWRTWRITSRLFSPKKRLIFMPRYLRR